MLRFLIIALLGLATWAPSVYAASDHTAPPGNSGVDQYFEAVPTASGPQRPGGTGSSREALPKKIQQALTAQGSDGAAVLRLVQSTAPAAARSRTGSGGPTSPTRPSNGGSLAKPKKGAAAPEQSVLASTAEAITVGGTGGGMGMLLPILLVISALAASAYVIVRRRSGRS